MSAELSAPYSLPHPRLQMLLQMAAEVQDTDALNEIADCIEEFATAVEAEPSRYRAYLPLQEKFRADPAPVKLIRAGNQTIGKTTAMLDDIHERCTGEHRYLQDIPQPPVEWWIVCAEASQSIAIQAKFHEAAQSHLDPSCEFSPATGFRGRQSIAVYRNGSIVRFKTTNQSSISFAGATLNGGIAFDEPPKNSRMYSEARKRVLRAGGIVMLALTPINANCDWLKDEVEKGLVSDHHARLTPRELIPLGCTQPLPAPHPITRELVPMDQAYIDALEASTIAYELPVVVHGEWEMRVEGRYFSAWDATTMVTSDLRTGGSEVTVCLGIDHGSKKGKEVAVLMFVEDAGAGVAERIWVWDAYVGTERTSMRDDAHGMLQMLDRNGISWSQIDKVWGDRSYVRGGDRKSNSDLMSEICSLLEIPVDALKPKVRTVKRGHGDMRGSVNQGGRFLHQMMLRSRFFVHPRVTRVIEAFDKWDFTDSDYKDPIDAVRYGLADYIFRRNVSSQHGRERRPVFMY